MLNKANRVDDNFIILKYEDNPTAYLYDLSNSNYYPFKTFEDIPKSVTEKFNRESFNLALLNRGDSEIENIEDYISKDIIDDINKNVDKPRIFVRQSDKQKDLVDAKQKLEKFYKIKINYYNKKEKYYFNYESNSYELLDDLTLGMLLEKDFNKVLPEKDVKIIYGMFRDVQKPNNDAIKFKNVVLDTRTFKLLPKDTFTIKKIDFNYLSIEEVKKDTLLEKTLKGIFIPANNPNDTDYYYDFLQRIGASFKRVNKHKFIYMLHGKGNDGKGIVLKSLSMLYKTLAVSIKPSNLTDDFFATNLSDTNVILIDELNKNSFNPQIVDILKDISGRGTRNVRIMYSQDVIEAKDYGVIIIATNNIPQVPFNQIAYWNRLIIIDLPNTFGNIENIKENQLLANEDLEFELQEDIDGVEWLISASIEAYKNKGKDFIISQSASATQLISENNNPVDVFISTFIEQTGTDDDVISNLEIKYYFLKWCIRNGITKKAVNINNTKELSREIGRVISNKFPLALDSKRKRNGLALYPFLICNYEDSDDTFDVNGLREEVERLEDMFFNNESYQEDTIVKQECNNEQTQFIKGKGYE